MTRPLHIKCRCQKYLPIGKSKVIKGNRLILVHGGVDMEFKEQLIKSLENARKGKIRIVKA